jgi:hypothetical protein
VCFVFSTTSVQDIFCFNKYVVSYTWGVHRNAYRSSCEESLILSNFNKNWKVCSKIMQYPFVKIRVVVLELLHVDRWIEMLKHIFGQLALQMYQKCKIMNFTNITMSCSLPLQIWYFHHLESFVICNSWVEINCENRAKQITFLPDTTAGLTHLKYVCVNSMY